MSSQSDDRPYMVLLGDDRAAVGKLAQSLMAAGSPHVECVGSAIGGVERVQAIVAGAPQDWPDAVIVDLASCTGQALGLVRQLARLVIEHGIALIAAVPVLDRPTTQALREAGASAVFFRQNDPQAYRREVDGIISFWARLQRLDAVGM